MKAVLFRLLGIQCPLILILFALTGLTYPITDTLISALQQLLKTE